MKRGNIMNPFVGYLNTLHNASGSNEHAIAENNIGEKDFFSKELFFHRNISEQLFKKLINGDGQIVILTGHAGDGKTSILQEIIRKCTGEELASNQLEGKVTYENGRNIYYVKDMSEHEKEKQISIFKEAISIQERKESIILISNTGPLFNILQELGMEEEKIIQMLDTREFAMVNERLDGKENVSILVANLALFDNSDIIAKFIERVVNEELWKPCMQCEKQSYCPIFFNKENTKENMKQVVAFAEWFYRWNFEHGERFTVRQMLAHIAYSFTGDMTCEQIRKLQAEGNEKRKLYNSFSNLFFGFHYEKGKSVCHKDALQIKPIYVLQQQKLDRKRIEAEYELYVQHNYSGLPKKISSCIEVCHKAQELQEVEEGIDKEFVRVVRRVYFMYHNKGDIENKELQKAVFSDMFLLYMKLQSADIVSSRIKNQIKNIVFHALHVLFMGTPPDQSDKIYLTLRRRGNALQKVQISQGYVDKEDFILKFNGYSNVTNGKNEKCVFLQCKQQKMELTLPMLEYFKEIESGRVITQVDKRLSQGVENIKTKIFRAGKKNEEEDTITVVYSEDGKFKKMELFIEDGKITVEK